MKTQFKFLEKPWLDKVFKVDEICEEDAPDWVVSDCFKELGGIIAIGLIKPGTDIGDTDEEIISFLESEVQWSNGIGASPQTMWVVPKTRGSLPAGTPTEEEGFGLEATTFNGDDRELTFEAQNVMRNREAVKAFNRRKGWGVVYVTAGYDSANDGYEAFYAKNGSMYMSTVIDQSIKSQKRWQGTVKWSTDGTPDIPFIAPASIFAP